MSIRFKVATLAACAMVYAAAGMAADKVRIVNEGGIRDEWMLADGVKLVAPGYPSSFSDRGDSVCVAMGYSIKPDGTTADFSVVKAWNSASADKEPVSGYWDAFSQASAQALSQWKFKPRPEIAEPKPTYTVATMTFMGKDGTDPAGLRSKCGIADLADLVQEQKSNSFQKSGSRQAQENARRAMEQQRQSAIQPIRGGSTR
jgi:surface antigen